MTMMTDGLREQCQQPGDRDSVGVLIDAVTNMVTVGID